MKKIIKFFIFCLSLYLVISAYPESTIFALDELDLNNSDSALTICCKVIPEKIYDNSKYEENTNTFSIENYTRNLTFLSNDYLIRFQLADPSDYGFCDYDSSSLEIKDIVNPATISIQDTQPDIIQVISKGSSYLSYNGSFSKSINGKSYVYYFSGKILVTIKPDGVYKISYKKTSDKDVETYEAILNDDENLTYYNRERIKWYSNNSLIETGNSCSGKNLDRSLSITYDNEAWQPDSSTIQENCTLVINNSKTRSIEKYWWIYDIVLIVLIIIALFMSSQIKGPTNLELIKKNINKVIQTQQKFENMATSNKYPRKKVLKEFKSFSMYLSLANELCESAVKEDYYELTDISAVLNKVDTEILAINKNREQISFTKLIKASRKTIDKISPCIELIDSTIKNQEISQNNAIAYRNSQIEDEKRITFIHKKKRVKVSDALNDLVGDDQVSTSIDSQKK